MCELFGINSANQVLCNEMLREFYSHGVDNPHGWGLALFYGNAVSLEKEPVDATKSIYLKNRLTEDIFADNLIAHIRKASKGGIEYCNSHPFVKRDERDRVWTLAHNGTIFESEVLQTYVSSQRGQTDSERILCCILDRVNTAAKKAGRALTEEERFWIVDGIIHEITPENRVNLLIYDGELLYVHTNYRDSLYQRKKDKSVYISTKPLKKGNWERVPMNTLFAYRGGVKVYEGKQHANEYMDSDAKTKYLFLDYANI